MLAVSLLETRVNACIGQVGGGGASSEESIDRQALELGEHRRAP